MTDTLSEAKPVTIKGGRLITEHENYVVQFRVRQGDDEIWFDMIVGECLPSDADDVRLRYDYQHRKDYRRTT